MKTKLSYIARDEEGIALIVAMGVLMVLGILGAVVAASSLDLSKSSVTDRNSKAALQAAQSGMEVARLRLTKSTTSTSASCIDGSSLSGRLCPGVSSGSGAPGLANGEAFTYYISRVLTSADSSCAGAAIPSDGNSYRCITSIGTSNSVQRRVSELMKAPTPSGAPDFGNAQLYAGGQISITENGKGSITGYPTGAATVGTNTGLSLTNTCTPTPNFTYDPGPGAGNTFGCGTGETIASPARTSAYPPVSNYSTYFGTTSSNDTSLAGNNDNSLLTPVFGSAANCSGGYYTVQRCLKDTHGFTLTLSGSNTRAGSNGIYVFNLCQISSTQLTGIVLTSGAKAIFLIDSQSRNVAGTSTPACVSALSPSLTLTNNAGFNCTKSGSVYTPGDPSALTFIDYGNSSDLISMSNSQCFSGKLIAPNSDIKFTGPTTWFGSLQTNGDVTATNGLDFHGQNTDTVCPPTATCGSGGGATTWSVNKPQGFVECRAQPTVVGDAESGC